MKKFTLITILCIWIINLYSNECTIYNNHIELKQKFNSQIVKNNSRSANKATNSGKNKSFNNFLYSLVLPGFSEYRLGYKKTAMMYWVSEALLVSSAIIFHSYGENKTTDYKNFAVRHAGISKTGKSDSYWISIGNYNNREEHNTAQYLKRYYSKSDILGPQHDWNWDSKNNRKVYDDLRINAEFAKTLSTYAIGAIALNHLASAVTASYLSSQIELEFKIRNKQYNTSSNKEIQPKIEARYNL